MNEDQLKRLVAAVRTAGGSFPTGRDWENFKRVIDEVYNEVVAERAGSNPVVVVASDTTGLTKAPEFYTHMKGTRILGPSLSNEEVAGCASILEACGKAGWGMGWTAYALATAYHETAGTMQPIKEYGRGKGRKYGSPGRNKGQIAYGRGYVQLTWDANYEKSDAELGLQGALVENYELALKHDIAAMILVRGMQEGWFTEKKLGDFIQKTAAGKMAELTACRLIINGRDKDRLIAGYAMEFQKALTKGEWK